MCAGVGSGHFQPKYRHGMGSGDHTDRRPGLAVEAAFATRIHSASREPAGRVPGLGRTEQANADFIVRVNWNRLIHGASRRLRQRR